MLTALPTGVLYGLAFVVGLACGSFLNVCIHRLPMGASVVFPASACPLCGRPIRAFDNVPVFSWLRLGGRCRDCNGRISLRYPLVELVASLLFLSCALHFTPGLFVVKYCLFSLLLLGLIFTDLEHLVLPDVLTLSGTVLGLAFSLVVWVQSVPGWTPVPHQRWEIRLLSLLNSAMGAAVGAGAVYLIAEIYRYLRGSEGIGLGDVKLMGMIGAFLGMRLALFTLFFGSAIGAALGIAVLVRVFLRRWRRFRSVARAWRSARNIGACLPVPFGSYLGLAGLIAAFWGRQIWDWYWGAI